MHIKKHNSFLKVLVLSVFLFFSINSNSHGSEKDINKAIIDQCRNSSDYKWCVKKLKRLVKSTKGSQDIYKSSKRNISKNESIFDLCKEARDFEGCVNTYSASKKSKNKNNSNELDFLGMPKLREEDGWSAIEDRVKRMINYLSFDVRKVKVRGMYGRYISYPQVLRFYSAPKAATPTEIYSSGITNLNCDEIGSSINCSGYGPTITTIPGDPGSPGGTVQLIRDVVIDCLDNSYKAIDKKFPTGKWRSINNGSHMSWFARNFCGKIEQLEISNIRKYEKGRPTKDDFKALKILPSKNF